MANSIAVENLSVVSHSNTPVITTELLAVLYETEPDYIRKNYNRNTDRFIAGKHYFLLEGEQLREFKHRMSLRPSVKIARNVRSLILWTERGAARHAKMLETDQAWEVFERLEDCYFSRGRQAPSLVLPRRFLVTIHPDGRQTTVAVSNDEAVLSPESLLKGIMNGVITADDTVLMNFTISMVQRFCREYERTLKTA